MTFFSPKVVTACCREKRTCHLRSTSSRQRHSREHVPVQMVIDVEISREARARVLPLFPRAIYLGLAKVRQTTQASSMLAQAVCDGVLCPMPAKELSS